MNLEWWNNPEDFKVNLTQHHTDPIEFDFMFMKIAREISKMVKCSSRQIGAILVRDRNIISIGYNGSPAKSSMCQDINATCPRKTLGFKSGGGLEYCPAQHAERNAITMAARVGASTDGTTLYAWCGVPCQGCSGALVNAGIKKIYCLERPLYDSMAEMILSEAGIEVIKLKENDILK